MPGQYFDAETGLNFNNARYYDKDAGRYTQFDPIGLSGGIDGYTYVENNPLNAIDPDGTQIVIPVPRPDPVPPIFRPFPKPWQPQPSSSGFRLVPPSSLLLTAFAINVITKVCSDEPQCTKATPWHFAQAGISDPERVKKEHGATPVSRFDLCACKDRTIVIKQVGTCGTSSPVWDTTEYTW